MHELAVCQELLEQVEQVARSHGGARVAAVHIRVGPLCGVECGQLLRAYEVARAGTSAQAAELAIEEAPVRVRCQRCDAESEARVQRLVCGACGDWRTRVVSGDELILMRVELESA